MNFSEMTIEQIRQGIIDGSYSAEDLVKTVLENIEKNKDINAFITINEKALEEARLIDEKIARGELEGRLLGLPIAVKDNIVTKDILTTAASKILGDFVPPYDASIVEILKSEGAIVIGKTNLDEFAMGSTGESSIYGPVKNPLNKDYVPGGSSSGSAAAVAANLVPFALGSDTGGSVRQPAGFNSCLGMKPSYGAVSRYGLISLSNGLDQIGFIGNNVKDLKLIASLAIGEDQKDSTTIGNKKLNFEEKKDLKFALIKDAVEMEMNPDLRLAFERSLEKLKAQGISVDQVEIPHFKYAVSTYFLINTAEASGNLARYDGIRYGYRADNYESLDQLYKKTRKEGLGQEVKRRIIAGNYVLKKENRDRYYEKAMKVRQLLKADFDRVFEDYDILISPTSPDLAHKLGDKEELENSYKLDAFTVPASLAGLAAITLPMEKVNGLGAGIQLMANNFEDALLLNGAEEVEAILGGER